MGFVCVKIGESNQIELLLIDNYQLYHAQLLETYITKKY